jgi:D-alanyl-lipoteichoic acid acyltransferase DltB (MBOAT superfamily)
MTLAHIAVFIGAALTAAWLLPVQWRRWVMLAGSIIAVYWLQPALPIRYLDFALPTATLALSVMVWWVTRDSNRSPQSSPRQQGEGEKSVHRYLSSEDRITLGVIGALVIGLSLTRYLVPELRPTASRAPDTLAVIVALAVLAGVGAALWRIITWRGVMGILLVLIVALFIILKTEPLAASVSATLRTITGQNPELAAAVDLRWLGFSYLAFRLIHVLRDRQTGNLPPLSLREHMTYMSFFPALTAGPIDRAERFVQDERALPVTLTAPCFVEAAGRIAVGLVKKFVISDGLALFALNAANAEQAISTPALWLLLYAYAFRLFLDFSGYTDIAIGIGLLVGIRLPENFNQPYVKPNLAAFWQSWHMTLSSWVRFYVFSPLSRALLVRRVNSLAAVLTAQLATMIVIGLWHAAAWNYLIWGLWHGVGLFAHKLWSDRTRRHYPGLRQRPRLERLWNIAGILLTFHFVTLGWVWFALTDMGQAWRVFLRLLGF